MVGLPGLEPHYDIKAVGDDEFHVTVTPPSQTKLPATTTKLTWDQYQRFQRWRAGEGLIQELLPELSGNEREMLITGIGQEDWDKMFKDEG